MTAASVARVLTASAGRYLQQLCKHWSHGMAVDFDAARGTVTFPREMRGQVFPSEGVVTMTAEPDALVVRIDPVGWRPIARSRS